jgi:hypothetical protein
LEARIGSEKATILFINIFLAVPHMWHRVANAMEMGKKVRKILPRGVGAAHLTAGELC